MTIWFSASCSFTILRIRWACPSAFANDFRRRLEQAQELPVGPCLAAEHAGSGLFDDLLHARRHLIDFPAQAFQRVSTLTPSPNKLLSVG